MFSHIHYTFISMLYLLDAEHPDQGFPDPQLAESEPNGLLAVGGDLSPTRLQAAYRQGIFPWYSVGQPILWWSPDPRMVLFPQRLHISRSLRRTLGREHYEYSFDQDFSGVIDGCAAPRSDADSTWILPEMRAAYLALHDLGFAHSVEVWQDDQLVGGLYGVALGRVFFGESMFSRASDGSKVALAALCARLNEQDYSMIDCQMHSDHLVRMGAEELTRADFLARLNAGAEGPSDQGWSQQRLSTTKLSNAV